ncbi:vacuolar aminopeptidase 1 [Sporothrix eucalyptigena]|uniref:Vacuolar aminopeptidase 1 n=1 Tax=Sporothrix eucalyptigena TaxID=1812306 RepID=A0ABP0B0G4_9PEZI
MARRDNAQMPLRYHTLRPATSYREQLNQRFASGSYSASLYANEEAAPPVPASPVSASSHTSSFAGGPTFTPTVSSPPSPRSTDPAAFTKPFLEFITHNPTVFHAVDYFEKQLGDAGFVKLGARDDWSSVIEKGGKYYVARNGSSLIAFTVGGEYEPGNGVAIVAGHIDALTAKLKPVSRKPTKAGYVQLGVAPYAGALNETWWDRDLAIGGRVVVQDPTTKKTTTRLVKLGWPIAKVATLAPHFGVSMTGSGNKETQMVPIIGLEGPGKSSPEALKGNAFIAEQPPKLVELIAQELGIAADAYGSIIHWELELYDHQPATLLGVDRDLLSAGRIDDKICSWAALIALLGAKDNDASGVIRLAALFDDEEIGSLLRQGAKGNFLPSTIERTVEALAGTTPGAGLVGRTYAASYLLSADVTHAVHPNFAGNYLDDHAPQLNVGITVAYDSNGHMTTDSVSTAILQRVADLSGATLQKFMIRNDSRSGGTIGPSLSSMLGVRSIDAGIPQLSMHSIRATTGALDPGLGVQLFQGFFEHYEKVDAEWQ